MTTVVMPPAEPDTFTGWQSERAGFIGNLSGAGFVLVALACVVSLVPITRHSWSAAVVALPVAALLLLLAYGRVMGLSAQEWIVLAVRHQIAVATKRNTFISGAFAPSTADGRQPMDLPGTLARLRILDAPDGLGGQVGIAHDPVDGTYTLVARISYSGLGLVDTERANNRVRAWGAFLRSHCKEDSSIIRLQIHQRSLPDDGAALREWTERHISPDAPAAAVQTLADLMSVAGPAATVRETYLSITLSSSRARMAIRSAGGGQVGAAAVLMREWHAMGSSIASAGLQVTELLTPRTLAGVIRTAYDPDAQLMLAARAAAASRPGWKGTPAGVDPALAGPSAAETSWTRYRHDGAWTVTYKVHGLPKSEVYATFLQPLLRPRTNARRSLSLVYEPIAPARARRELAREKTRRQATRTLRRKAGRDESEDQLLEAQTAHAQDVARAQGQGVVRTIALISVTVTDLDQLESACADLQADASEAGLDIKRSWGTQDDAFAAGALPLGRGLPNLRMPL
ncbi:SCO6880 family protein [Kitasatospora sp. NPDC052868]|uniref:SCO6880 family protein n=1 Tax=Kitasatospora sp. NPDC052868 TaxID=3364060 RepID=UPI0037C9E62D